MKGLVTNPGKEQDNYTKTGKKVSAGFEIEENGEKQRVWVNANNVQSPKADFLLSLRRGDTVEIIKEKARGDIPEYWDIDTWALIASGGVGGSDDGGKPGFMDEFAKSRKRAKWFQEQGIKVAEEVWAEHFQSKPQEKDMGTLFDRGGAIGTGLHMDMIAKGHK
jgi:hypothetical protein